MNWYAFLFISLCIIIKHLFLPGRYVDEPVVRREIPLLTMFSTTPTADDFRRWLDTYIYIDNVKYAVHLDHAKNSFFVPQLNAYIAYNDYHHQQHYDTAYTISRAEPPLVDNAIDLPLC